jgi:hypothetical protein
MNAPRLNRNRAVEPGQSLVEFALVLPILIILLLGVFDFGRAIAAYNSVSNGARSAARVAIVNQDPEQVEAAAIAEAFWLVPIEVEFDPNADPSQDDCPRIGCIIEVRVSYEYVPATPIFSALVGTITVSSASQMPIEAKSP